MEASTAARTEASTGSKTIADLLPQGGRAATPTASR